MTNTQNTTRNAHLVAELDRFEAERQDAINAAARTSQRRIRNAFITAEIAAFEAERNAS